MLSYTHSLQKSQVFPGPDRDLEAHQHLLTNTPSEACWRHQEEQKSQPSKDCDVNCKPPHPKAKFLSQICRKQDALFMFRVPSGVLGCTQALWSESWGSIRERNRTLFG